MTDVRRPAGGRPLALALVAMAAAAALAITGCSAAPAPSPSASGGPSPTLWFTPPPTPARTPVVTPRPTGPSTTNTDWGEIWDSLPDTFPVYPGAEPTEATEGPATAVLSTPDEPLDVIGWMRPRIERAGFRTTAQNTLEDGVVVLDSVGTDPACKLQTAARPMGGATLITILYGSACPAP